jgi:hypothetical protein
MHNGQVGFEGHAAQHASNVDTARFTESATLQACTHCNTSVEDTVTCIGSYSVKLQAACFVARPRTA